LPETKVDGAKCGKGRVDKTEPLIFSADETCDWLPGGVADDNRIWSAR
jgi:hypothetical protein